MSDTPPVPTGTPVSPPEEPNKITYDPTAHLTEEQKKWRVVKLVQGERFTMLEPKGPNNLTDEQKTWPVVEGGETRPKMAEADLALLRGLIDRHGPNQLHHLIEAIASGSAIETR
jgi:hypothetical protein